MISLGQVRTGTKIIHRGLPHEVVEANHLKMGRGGAKLQTKLRNLIDQAIYDYTFAGDEKLEEANVGYRAAQFLYKDDRVCHFMLNDTFEQVSLRVNPDKAKFLKDGEPIDLMLWQDRIIDAKVPKKITAAVAYTEPASKGNTVNAAQKNATLETGAIVKVPLFVKTGDLIEVNTESETYSGRAA